MPARLRGQYQNPSPQAPMERLRAAGYAGPVHAAGGRRATLRAGLPGAARPVSLMLPVLLFPQFDPVLVQVGPFAIRWYALAYIAGLLVGWRLVRRLVQRRPAVATAAAGGRLPHLGDARRGARRAARLRAVLPAGPVPGRIRWQILAVWDGGMCVPRRHAGRRRSRSCCSAAATASRCSASPTASRWPRRSAWASAASPISSTASCGAARRRTGCPGR